MRLLNILILTAISHCLAFSSALAVEPGRSVNGCGPDGILGHIVPNHIRVLNCELEKACNAHDICYGRCLKGGDLHGNPTCNDDAARRRRRSTCDDALFASIGSANHNRFACRAVARLYKSFVRAAGGSFFQGILPPRYSKEELYRVPSEDIENGSFAAEFGVQVKGKLEQNYAAVDAFAHYVEANPDKLTKAEIESALDSIETYAMRENYAFEFKSGPSGAELILKSTLPVTDGQDADVVIWREGS